MKKILVVLLLATLSIQAFSQKGNLTVGAKGGYVISPEYYNGILYGLDISYHISDPLEVVLTGLMNYKIHYEDYFKTKKELTPYSANLDFRLYLIRMRDWATGPALGGQFYYVNSKEFPNNKDVIKESSKALGFNIGWHLRVNLTDYVKLNGGWKYTNAKDKGDGYSFDMSHHLLYLGIGYTFELR